MATTTPNYGWAVPTSTDLVKDGATAIETLGDAIDASMNTALGTKKAGMVLLNTTSFSGVATQSVNDVFSATYDFYKVVLNLTTITADGILTLRLRVGGTDVSTNYGNQTFYINDDGTSGGFAAVSTGLQLCQIDLANNIALYSSSVDIFGPFLTQRTTFQKQSHGVDVAATGIRSYVGGGFLNNATSYTGLTIFSTAGNITGKIQIYGYNQ